MPSLFANTLHRNLILMAVPKRKKERSALNPVRAML